MPFGIFTENPVDPRCRHFKICGGCKFQHIPYEEQLEYKRAYVSDCFGKVAAKTQVDRVLPCKMPWHYRNKMEFTFSQSQAGQKFLGLMKQRGRVEDLSECHLANPWFIESLSKVRNWWANSPLRAYHPPSNQGQLRNLTLREGIRTGEKMVLLTVSDSHISEDWLSGFADLFKEIDAVILRKQIVQKKIPTRFEELILRGKDHIHEVLQDAQGISYRFRIRAASFFQPNTFQAEMIYQEAIALADLKKEEQILDLYCGTGSLGIFASSHVSRVVGIEIVPEAVEDAHYNLQLNQISNMEVLSGDVGKLLATLPFSPSTIIVDPPRVGLGKQTISHLLELNPEKIVYVSCNPVSQADDCAQLGYEIICLQPIDQFPHTPHVENIAFLQRPFFTNLVL